MLVVLPKKWNHDLSLRWSLGDSRNQKQEIADDLFLNVHILVFTVHVQQLLTCLASYQALQLLGNIQINVGFQTKNEHMFQA